MITFGLILLAGLVLFVLVTLIAPSEPASEDYFSPRFDTSAIRPCHLPDLDYRPYTPDDRDFCIKIHEELTSAELAPRSYDADFLAMLDNEESPLFIITSTGKPIACCGVRTQPNPPLANLYYGLMPLNDRNSGIGSLSLVLRLWLVSFAEPFWATMSTTPYSTPYYSRFGFEKFPDSMIPIGSPRNDLQELAVVVTPELQRELLEYLKRHFGEIKKLNISTNAVPNSEITLAGSSK